MSYYGVVVPEYWTGRTGRALRKHGRDAQLIGLYLVSNRHGNLLGLYKLLPDDITHETGIKRRWLVGCFQAMQEHDYAIYDDASNYVWVRTMLRYRLGLKRGEALDPDDNRVKAVNKVYHALDPNPFLGEFFDANAKALHLNKKRASAGLVVAMSETPYMSGLPRGLEGACKPVTESGDRRQ